MEIFGIFSRMLSNMPAHGVLRALEAECKMMEADLKRYHENLREDVRSILCFGQFIRMVNTHKVERLSMFLPFDHVEFYKETIIRLIQAQELPPSSMDDFDFAFSL